MPAPQSSQRRQLTRNTPRSCSVSDSGSVEELQGRPGFDVCTDDGRGLQIWIMPIPAHRNHENMLAEDFMTGAMFDGWCRWSMWTWLEFGRPQRNEKDWFQRITFPWFFRAFTPAADPLCQRE